MPAAYLLSAARTPIGRFRGALAPLTAPQLAAVAIQAALERAGVSAQNVQEVILGCVLTAGVGQAPARQAALAAGIPFQVPAFTVNKVCGSGLKAVMLADQAIRAGDADLIVAGGMESMSRAPHLLPGSREGLAFGHAQLLDSLLHDGLWCATENRPMGALAEGTAAERNISRVRQDTFALESHRRAIAAQQAGHFSTELVPVTISGRKGNVTIERDEGPRADASLESLARLSPAFATSGTITAGNASQLSDGAAALVVASERFAANVTSPVKARIVACAASGTPPKDLFVAPIEAMQRVLSKAGLRGDQIDLWDINEAFAAQCLACVDGPPLDIDLNRVNVHGGAIALGHPIGASGARVLVTLLHALAHRQQRLGLAALCLGGGNAVAMIVERV